VDGRGSKEKIMTTVTLGVASREDVSARLLAAMSGQEQGAFISFESADLLFRTMTHLRWNIIKTITGTEPLSIREIARRVGRDVKAVHRDVHALLAAGVIERNAKGLVVFPYDAVHVDFTLTAA
jgi:predicted transcriptional regulator